MNTLILDIGCSNTKFYFFRDGHLEERRVFSTPRHQEYDLWNAVLRAYNEMIEYVDVDKVMPISYSDSVWYETKTGVLRHIPVFSDIQRHPEAPDYQVAGKPGNSELLGIASQLLHLRDTVDLGSIKRILPTSTLISARLSGDRIWNIWDITHAGNSGMWDYENARWCPEMQPFIDAGLIDEEVVSPKTERPGGIYVGGHDSVFANANDVPYSTKPYLSLGTWVTASVEKEFKKQDRNAPTRFVPAPNGTTLEQLCINAENNLEKVYEQVITFFESRLPKNSRIKLFGGWKEGFNRWLDNDDFQFVLEDIHYLHKQAARYIHDD